MNPKDKHADWLLKPTANDLADELDRMLNAIGLTGNRIPTILRQQEVEIKRITSKYEEMLRQQQADLKDADKYALELERLYEDAKAEIEALKQIIDANNLNQNIGQFVKPTNEPVAWARQDGVIAFHKQKEVDSQGFKWFPLYTHPVKELTDEEIDNVSDEVSNLIDTYAGRREFARAILRKAQEK